MSVRVSDAVWRESQAVGAARLVLLALADVAADHGEISAYARSHRALAAKAKIDERTVRKAIRQLEDLGELTVVSQGAGRVQSDYVINLPSLQRGREGPSHQSGSTGPSERATDPVSPAPRAPQPGPTGQAIIPSLSVDIPSLSPGPPALVAVNGTDPAREIVDAVWAKWKATGRALPTVRSGSPYMALVALARKLLEAGHDPQLVRLAFFDHDSAWTNDSVLVTLGKIQKGKVSDPRLASAIRDQKTLDRTRAIRERNERLRNGG